MWLPLCLLNEKPIASNTRTIWPGVMLLKFGMDYKPEVFRVGRAAV